MLVFALKYQEAIDEISGDRDMRKYELSEEEWELCQQLCDVLGVHCTGHLPFWPFTFSPHIQGCDAFLSCSMPNLATVIPAMDHIDVHLANAS